jgi:transposase
LLKSEICGFNEWLLETLKKFGCTDREIVIIQPDKTSNKKTDCRDANILCEMLWNNRLRLQNGERPIGIRRVVFSTPEDKDVRQLASLRRYFTKHRTKCINKIRGVLRKHNLEQDCPAKNYKSQRAKSWLKIVELSEIDRLEVNRRLAMWETADKSLLEIEEKLAQRSEGNKNVELLTSIPGINHFGARTLLLRIGDVERFPTPDSLANYVGLTPGCHSAGGKTHHTPITKAGSSIVRAVLNAAVIHVTRKDTANGINESKNGEERKSRVLR